MKEVFIEYSKGSEYMRRLLLSNTLNTRDLGGYSIDCEKITAYKVFLRSDEPIQVSDDDVELLLSNNIVTIVDLRSDDEVQLKPCALKNNKKFEYYHCKMYGDGRVPVSAKDVPNSYLEMVDDSGTILNIMRVFVKSRGGILYHCASGKDRTGVVSALLLLLAGVCKTDILADYHISQVYLNSMLKQFCKTNKNIDENIVIPKIEYMERFLHMFEKKYSSVEDYFSQIGLTDSEILELKIRLISRVA